MSKQTVKDYWTDRITAHFDQLIEEVASKEPDLQSRVSKEARKKAIAALGLSDLKADEAKVLTEIEKCNAKLETVRLEMYAKVRGIPIPPKAEGLGWQWREGAEAAISRRQRVEEDALLAKNEVGKEIASLKD